ncbi:type IV toxin-antitoxin system AbiEi family antitoxin [Modicisalibacter radicis]|uniref:type IV toxin-antitoxin system AbiEi family antitoxin n=1 Tax=Halomonas sp. EAR18 TaxID=2518972 RepID=UPI0014444F75|nr:type IV toxin-antitoxin system AbiEi family antitoxin [Halomonas sp. EAR18]
MECEIAEAAIAAFQRETGLSASLSSVPNGAQEEDINVELGGHHFPSEIKRWAAHLIPALSYHLAGNPGRLLIADYLNASAAKKLQAQGIQFIDTAGNAFIDRPDFKILIRGNGRSASFERGEEPHAGQRAFQRQGLIVVYHLLIVPDLVNASVRAIAERTGVSHGTVANVLKALETGGLVATRHSGERRVIEPRKLMERWVLGYCEKLAPKLLIGEFYGETTDWWGEHGMDRFAAAWGGEIAGAFFSGHLTPQMATLFLPREHLPQLMQQYRLRKPPAGVEANIRLMERFWRTDDQEPSMVHPLLAYADLIRSGDSRNAEIARILDERYLADHFSAS